MTESTAITVPVGIYEDDDPKRRIFEPLTEGSPLDSVDLEVHATPEQIERWRRVCREWEWAQAEMTVLVEAAERARDDAEDARQDVEVAAYRAERDRREAELDAKDGPREWVIKKTGLGTRNVSRTVHRVSCPVIADDLPGVVRSTSADGAVRLPEIVGVIQAERRDGRQNPHLAVTKLCKRCAMPVSRALSSLIR